VAVVVAEPLHRATEAGLQGCLPARPPDPEGPA
jgi:hypothetical protein